MWSFGIDSAGERKACVLVIIVVFICWSLFLLASENFAIPAYSVTATTLMLVFLKAFAVFTAVDPVAVATTTNFRSSFKAVFLAAFMVCVVFWAP